MSKELTYQSSQGHTIFTSQFLKNKGTCCKSACLHCPYGYTLKKLGLQFLEVKESDFLQVEDILKSSGKEAVNWKEFWPEHIWFIQMKDHVCGLFLKNHIVIKHLYLLPNFQNQGLSREMVESYFFI